MGNNPFEKYKQAQVMTASPEKILLMMYAGAIKFLRQSIEAANRNDTAEKTRLIGRAQDIINELRATLNFEAGGDLATELDKLYVFITTNLLKANQGKDVKPIEESLKVLVTLNEGWEGAVQNLSNP